MKKSKSVFGLSVAGATLASAIGFASPAGAFNFTYNNATYDVTTHTGSFNDLKSTLTAPNNALWGNASLSEGLAGVVMGSLGYPYPLVRGGPLFAYDDIGILAGIYDYPIKSYVWIDDPNVGFTGVVSDAHARDSSWVYAKATATAVPEPLTILGSITATGFLAAFNRIKNKKEE